MQNLEHNIGKLYAIRALRSFMLIMPVMALFFQENGLSVHEIFLLQAIFSLVLVLLEIPTGYFADIISRKSSIIIGGIISTLGWCLYAASYGFWGFLVSEILLGVGMSFVSSADAAMLQDTLLALGRGGEYQKRQGRNTGIATSSEAVASIIGGLIAVVSLRLPLILDIFSTFLILPIAWSLIEPKRQKRESKESSIRSIMAITHYALVGHREVGLLILYTGFVSASTLTMVWFSQPYLLEGGLPIAMFGIVWASLLGVASLCSWYAEKIEDFFGRKNTLVLLWFLPVLGYFLTGLLSGMYAFVLLVCFYVTRGILNPVLEDYINHHVSSDIRATVLSVKNVPSRFIFMVVGPGVSFVGDVYSLQSALLVTGGIFLLSGGTILLLMKKRAML